MQAAAHGAMALPSLLIVDDEPDIVDIGRICFETCGWRVLQASDVAHAKKVLSQEAVDAVLSDLMMRGGSGLELLSWVRDSRGQAFVFYLLTACLDERVADARRAGATGVFTKPCEWPEVIQTLSRAVAKPQT